MSETISMMSVLEAVNSLPSDQVKIPNQPVDIYIQEAENLLQWSLPDKEMLLAKGLDPFLFDAMPFSLSICRDAQAKWAAEQKLKSDATKAWQEQAPIGYALRDQLLADFRYAFRKDKELLKSVALIAEGTGNADMIQDLADLAALGKLNPIPLAAINFNIQQIDTATSLSSTLSGLLATSNGDKKTENAIFLFRNKAFTYLKNIVDEIRDCGKYAFRNIKLRRKGYKSDYLHKKYLKQVATVKAEKESKAKAIS
jgi:hypothetical protein